jgi:hypothetical protein
MQILFGSPLHDNKSPTDIAFFLWRKKANSGRAAAACPAASYLLACRAIYGMCGTLHGFLQNLKTQTPREAPQAFRQNAHG